MGREPWEKARGSLSQGVGDRRDPGLPVVQAPEKGEENGGGAHRIHVDAVGVGPGMLEILLQALAQRVGNLVEADELPHA